MAELNRDALMMRIQQACFAAHECVLYLDGHPYNRKAMAMHKKYAQEAKDLIAQYESNFGPLTADGSINRDDGKGGKNGWRWSTEKWPWHNMED